eukprot:5745012-Pyramimonas_sp.AAC.1
MQIFTSDSAICISVVVMGRDAEGPGGLATAPAARLAALCAEKSIARPPEAIIVGSAASSCAGEGCL